MILWFFFFFFFNDTATTEIYTLSLHDALPIYILNVLIQLFHIYLPNRSWSATYPAKLTPIVLATVPAWTRMKHVYTYSCGWLTWTFWNEFPWFTVVYVHFPKVIFQTTQYILPLLIFLFIWWFSVINADRLFITFFLQTCDRTSGQRKWSHSEVS